MAHHIKEKATSAAAKILEHTSSHPSAPQESTTASKTPSRAPSPATSTTSGTSGKSQKSTKPPISPTAKRDLASLKSAKYLLKVTAGPSYDTSTHRTVNVNSPDSLAIENDHILASIRVHINNYKGLPLSSPPTSPYFSAPSRQGAQYSISYSFVPKHDICADTATWGNEQDDPIRDRLPPGFNLAVRLVKSVVDPSIDVDGYADRPWAYAPVLTSFFAWRIGEKREKWEDWKGGDKGTLDVEDGEPLEEGGDGDGAAIRENLGIPASVDARKKHFRSQENRQAFKVFEAGRLYQADFFNGYIDFSEFALCLPGLKINCMRAIGDKTHRLRWVFKTGREGAELLFCVVFTLLHGDELLAAVKEEEDKLTEARSKRSSVRSDASNASVDSENKERHPDFGQLTEEQKLGIDGKMDHATANEVLEGHGMESLKIT